MKLLHSLLLRFIAPMLLLLVGAMSLIIPHANPTAVQVAGLANWFTWDTLLYLVIIIIGGFLTLVSLKYRTVMVELKELLETIRKAYEDKLLTDAERKSILKEALDVVRELIYLAWKPVGFTAKAIKRAVAKR